MRFRNLMVAVPIVVLSSAVFYGKCRAASIVDVSFVQAGKTVAEAVFWGADGGPRSESAPYWDLLGRASSKVEGEQLKPDQANGKLATLKGPVQVYLVIRNQFCMGAIKMEGVTFERPGPQTKQWNLTSADHQRLMKLVRSNLMKTVMVEYLREYHTLARTIYIVPEKGDLVAADFWNLLGRCPDYVRSVSKDLDKENGDRFTQEGDLSIEITPYPWVMTNGNAYRDGVVELRSLELIRESKESDEWHLSDDECRRIVRMVGKRPDRRTSGRPSVTGRP